MVVSDHHSGACHHNGFGAGIDQRFDCYRHCVYAGLYPSGSLHGAVRARNGIYVQGARAIGLWFFRIIVRYILPNVFPVIIVQASLNAAQAIISEASLSFMGLGIQPPESRSWGLYAQVRISLSLGGTWLSIYPGLLIFADCIGAQFSGRRP